MTLSARTQECFNKVLSHAMHIAVADVIGQAGLLEHPASDEDLTSASMNRIMLTISAIDFRVTFLLHYADDPRIRSVIQAGDDSAGGMADLDAYFLETGNRFCGEAKRLCYESFDHLGMSTPCVLSATTTLSDMLGSDLMCEGHVGFSVSGQPLLGGSIYVYGDRDIDFDLDDSQFSEQEGAGELEFF